MSRIINISKIILINILVIIALIISIDFTLTKLDLMPIKAWMSGKKIVGFSQPLVTIGNVGQTNNLTKIAILGDSHHTISKDNKKSHQSTVLHNELETNGIQNTIYSLGTPRYSLIQELVAYEHIIKPQAKIDIAVFLLYAGNDFAELLRHDDRPFLSKDKSGKIVLNKPNWVLERVRGEKYTRWPEDSRLLYTLNSILPNNIILKIIASQNALNIFHPTIAERISYLLTLRGSADSRFSYRGAAPSQFLNQYYLYQSFPQAFLKEVKWHLTYFFTEFRKLNPNTKLYVFFLPSAPAIDALDQKSNIVLKDILKRNNMLNYNFQNMESKMFKLLVEVKNKSGIKNAVIHNLSPALYKGYKKDSSNPFYDMTLHIQNQARVIVGKEIAKTILSDYPKSKTKFAKNK